MYCSYLYVHGSITTWGVVLTLINVSSSPDMWLFLQQTCSCTIAKAKFTKCSGWCVCVCSLAIIMHWWGTRGRIWPRPAHSSYPFCLTTIPLDPLLLLLLPPTPPSLMGKPHQLVWCSRSLGWWTCLLRTSHGCTKMRLAIIQGMHTAVLALLLFLSTKWE